MAMDLHVQWFLDQRANIVENLDQYAHEIAGLMPNYIQIAELVAAEKHAILSLLSLPNAPLGSRIETCVGHRIATILDCIDVVSQLLQFDLGHKAYEGLLMISRQVGRLRLVSLEDPCAEEMDRQALAISCRYDLEWDPAFNELQGMEGMWRMLNDVVPTCNCPHCRG